MQESSEKFFERFKTRMHTSRFGRLFYDRKFFHYTWIAIVISLLNIFFLWLLIDIFDIPTLIASTLVVLATFITRYVLFDLFKIL